MLAIRFRSLSVPSPRLPAHRREAQASAGTKSKAELRLYIKHPLTLNLEANSK